MSKGISLIGRMWDDLDFEDRITALMSYFDSSETVEKHKADAWIHLPSKFKVKMFENGAALLKQAIFEGTMERKKGLFEVKK